MPSRDPDFARPPAGKLDPAIRDAAAAWFVRRDRGLSPEEQAEFQRWLEADPRHGAALKRTTSTWSLLAELPARDRPPVPAAENKIATPTKTRTWRWLAVGGLAAAAVVVLGIYVHGLIRPGLSTSAEAPVTTAAERTLQTKRLSDGTVVRLNIGASLAEEFTARQRNVRLLRGEAYFAVTKDATRPFVVSAGNVAVRAVGTEFNVRMQPEAVDVIVTEGTVQVTPPTSASSRASDPASPLVAAGQRAVVAVGPTAVAAGVKVSPTSTGEVARELAWRDPLLKLGGATLAEIALQFEQKTGRKLVLTDPMLAQMRIGGRFPSDDVDGFVQVLEANYGVVCVRLADGSLQLGRRP